MLFQPPLHTTIAVLTANFEFYLQSKGPPRRRQTPAKNERQRKVRISCSIFSLRHTPCDTEHTPVVGFFTAYAAAGARVLANDDAISTCLHSRQQEEEGQEVKSGLTLTP